MRTDLLAILALYFACTSSGATKPIKPTEFEPLTSIPWEQADATVDQVLARIFLEPDREIRRLVLSRYFRELPLARIPEAFDQCLALEGAEDIGPIVTQLLPVWAERDPKRSWERTRSLAKIVINGDPLEFDSWEQDRPIVASDPRALQGSRYRLACEPLVEFPGGVERSTLPVKERVNLMRAFADLWFQLFDSWPGGSGDVPDDPSNWSEFSRSMHMDLDQSRRYSPSSGRAERIVFEIALRRWLEAEPSAAPEIVRKAQSTIWAADHTYSSPQPAGPSHALLLIWARVDLPGFVKWAEALDPSGKGNQAIRGFLMAHVDDATRKRWLEQAGTSANPEDATIELCESWMKWDPQSAVEAAIKTGDVVAMSQLSSAVYGPWNGQPYNTSGYGISVIRDLDLTRLKGPLFSSIEDWYMMMEQWDSISTSEAARFGFKFLTLTGYAPREGLIRFFSGEDIYPGEDGMIDRTFGALRIWAVMDPAGMKAWISEMKDAEMRKALTWLLEHPWGGPKKATHAIRRKR